MDQFKHDSGVNSTRLKSSEERLELVENEIRDFHEALKQHKETIFTEFGRFSKQTEEAYTELKYLNISAEELARDAST